MKNFEEEIADILEVDSVEMYEDLNSFMSWSSLSILAIIAYADEHHNKVLSHEEINNCTTIGDLKDLITSNTINNF